MKDENSDRKGTLKEMNERECGRTGSVAVQNKKECDIIQDLLPSYVDNICSEASREWIEEHLAECSTCRQTAELMKNTELSSKRMEQEGLDAARKVIRKNLWGSMINLVLCLILGGMMIFVFGTDMVQIPNLILYIAMPICMAMTWLVCQKQSKVRKWDRWDFVCLTGTVLVTMYGALVLGYGFNQALKGETIFRLELNEFGPFLYGQMVLAAVLCFAVYFVQMVRVARRGRNGSLLMNVCLVGIFLMLACCVHMGYLMDLETAVRVLRKTMVVTLLIGAAGTVCFFVLDKVFGKR